MDTLQDTLELAIQETLSIPYLLAFTIKRKLNNEGTILSEEQFDKIKEAIQDATATHENQMLGGEKISLDLDFLGNEDIVIDEPDLDEAMDRMTSMINEIYPKAVDESADLLYVEVHKTAKSALKHHRKDRKQFAKRLAEVWRHPLDLLEALILLAYESGEGFNNEMRSSSTELDTLTEALTRIHARACQIAFEVRTLLNAGFADGAHARWRALHELAVVSFFLSSGGNNVAERYLDHSAIESYKAAKQFQQYCARLNYAPLPDKEFAQIKSLYDAMIDHYGPEFRHQYGWAGKILNNPRANFTDIERAVNLEHWRPYYKLASYNVHAQPKGMLYRLGLDGDEDSGVLLAGPSNSGLDEPGCGTAISLSQITTVLLTSEPNLDRLVICTVLTKFTDEICDSFRQVQTELIELTLPEVDKDS